MATPTAWLRKSLFEWVWSGGGSLKEAAERLGLSYRQARRSYKRWREEGDAGLVHRGRGVTSNRGIAGSLKTKVLRRCTKRFLPLEMGPTLMSEKLADEGIVVDHETLRRLLIKEGLWSRHRKRTQYRSRREPRARFGELVQMDGSHHRWFGEDGPETCLMVMVDDATGHTMSLMDEEETTAVSMRLLRKWIEVHGVPCALYTDHKNVFITDREPTLEEQLAGEEPRTVFGKACAKLGIEIIAASSPRAKGRVERKHQVFQDRLVVDFLLKRITTIKGANTLLENEFADFLNAKFAKAPASPEDAHSRVPKGINLDDVFSFEQDRVLTNDWTIRYENALFQILGDNNPLPKPKDKILVRRRLDNTLILEYCGRPLNYRKVTPGMLRAILVPKAPRTKSPPTPTKASGRGKARSPWRHGCVLNACGHPSRRRALNQCRELPT